VKVILTQDVSNLGEAGDLKDVADGYARNYLLRRGLAVRATAGAMKEFKRQQVIESRREERMAAHAEALARRLSDVSLEFEAKAGETGHLYGSITPNDIAEALEREIGESFDRRKQILCDPIREIGRHIVSVRLSREIVAEVKVVVKPEGGELPEEAEGSSEGSAEGSVDELSEEPAEALAEEG
jgi:large subunit ribosomal protein L9